MGEHRTAAGTQVKHWKELLREKGRMERGLRERLGRKDDGSCNHPVTRLTGLLSASNVGEDLTSGDG